MPALHRSARFAAIIAAGVCFSCGGNDSLSPAAPTIISIAITSTSPAIGASTQFTATASQSGGTTRDVTSLAAWQSTNNAIATVSSTGLVSAVAAGDVDIRATYQSFTASRGITIAALPCRFSVSPATLTVRSAGEPAAVSVTVTQGTDCAWTAVSNDVFITIASGAAGTGTGAVILTVAANTGGARTGTVTIAGVMVTVAQDPGSNCVTSISPTTQNFGENGPAAGTVTVTAPSNCSWTATTAASFLTITGGASGTGNGTVTYSVASNAANTSRSGTLTIDGRVLTVTQDGRPCAVSVSPTHLDVDGAGCRYVGGCAVAFPITITMTGSCAWTASANDAWLGAVGTVGAPSSGTGTATITPRIDQNNTGQSRNGSLTIAGQPVTVTQTACAFSLSPEAVTVGSAATTVAFTASSTASCLYNFVRDTVFLQVGFQSIGFVGTNTITVTVPENTSASPRTEPLQMYGRESTSGGQVIVATTPVTQSGKP